MNRTLPALLCCLFSCTRAADSNKKPITIPAPPSGGIVVVGAKLRAADGSVSTKNVHISAGTITAIDEARADDETTIEANGAFLVPTFIDSHMHMTFSEPSFALQGGISAGLDLGAPATIWEQAPKMLPFHLFPVGQLLTAVGGYPTQGWGADGYGREIRGVEDARAAVQEVAKRGAKLVKMPLEPSSPMLTAEEQEAIVETAHSLGLPVGSHALYQRVVQTALDVGVDVLVHAPVERLTDDLIQRFCARPKAAVVTTFQAFGGDDAIDNVKRMKKAGCQVFYGSDLGNGVSSGIILAELEDMQKAGMTPAEILDAATAAPAKYFGLTAHGEIAVGKKANFLLIDGDPYQDISKIERRKIYIEGAEIK